MPRHTPEVRKECDLVRADLQREEQHIREHISLPHDLAGVVYGYLSKAYVLDLIESALPCYDVIFFEGFYNKMAINCHDCAMPGHYHYISSYNSLNLHAPNGISRLIDLYIQAYELGPPRQLDGCAESVRRWLEIYT